MDTPDVSCCLKDGENQLLAQVVGYPADSVVMPLAVSSDGRRPMLFVSARLHTGDSIRDLSTGRYPWYASPDAGAMFRYNPTAPQAGGSER